MNPWPHQPRGVESVLAAIAAGQRRICLQSPTGGGKSLMMQMLAKKFLAEGKRVILYTNRRMLIDQASQVLLDAGIYHGVRAAGYDDEREHPFQVSSIQTEHSRVSKKKKWLLHAADLVLVDEAHIQKGTTQLAIIDEHEKNGAVIVGVTATPLDIGHIYRHLVTAGTMTELRDCGALVTAVHYGPDEPDLKSFRKLQEGSDPTAAQQKKAMMTPGLFGRVWEWYCKLNPLQKPCVLFGPGVDESLWFAEQFWRKGVAAAHIDGSDVWENGKLYASDNAARDAVRAGSKDGSLKVVCNRYVLREGVDWPWIEHVILAFVAGSLQTYIQVGGRGLRASPSTGKEQLIVQDHGGAWWRHGSLNADRIWELDLTADMAYGLRADLLREKKKQEPFRCPKCGRIWTVGTRCQPAHGGCGFELGHVRKSRPVVSTEGVLKEMHGDVFVPRRTTQDPRGPQIWERMYWRSRTEKGARTFRAAAALFAYENNWGWPDKNWPLMPIDPRDAYRLVADVPMERLVQHELSQV